MNPIKIVIAGDLLPSENNYSLFEKGDALELFGEDICRLFSDADFSVANLEGPLTDSIKPQKKAGPATKAPTSTITGIKKLGLSAVALANNHITDYQQQGVDDTIKVLNESGIIYVGICGNNAVPKKFLSLSIKGKKLCIYNVSESFFNQPEGNLSGANVYDEWIVCNEIKELKKKHDFLIVIYHGGAEYLPYPTPQTRTRFHRMADCGADFITAQHTHCIGCEEWYKGSYLLHGQGKFLFARQKKYPNITKEGLVSEINLFDEGFSVKNHLVKINDFVLRYDKDQNLTAFYERSKRVDDTDFIIKEFTELKVEEIMHRFLKAAKGNYPLRRYLNRLFPRFAKHPEQSYSLEQILLNFNVLQGERRREDLYYIWKWILEKKLHQ